VPDFLIEFPQPEVGWSRCREPRRVERSGASTRLAASSGPSRCRYPAGSSSRDFLPCVSLPLLVDLFQNPVVLLSPLRREGPGTSPQPLTPSFRGRVRDGL